MMGTLSESLHWTNWILFGLIVLLPWTQPLRASDPTLSSTESSIEFRSDDLATPTRICANGRPIDVDGFAAPFVGDFDEDGVNDLLVGQSGYGRLRIYRNEGTNDQPSFGSFSWFVADGRIAAVPVGCVVGFTPQLVDYDGDGRTDVLTGSFCGGALFLFRRLPDGTFSEGEILQDDKGPLTGLPRYNSTVFVYDWDGDRHQDLIIGKSARLLIRNHGTNAAPIYSDAVRIEINGRRFHRGMVAPFVADWDGDGRDDLLAGRLNEIVWYRNTSESGAPVLDEPRVLVARDNWNSRVFDPVGKGPHRPQAICAADMNGDGRLDLLLGDHAFVKNTLGDRRVEDLNVARTKSLDARSECFELLCRPPENETRSERVARYRQVLAKWQNLASYAWVSGGLGDRPEYVRHGSVWLYERTDVDQP